MHHPAPETRDVVRDALRLLGKRRLLLSIHDASFPSASLGDLGRGSPYSEGAADFLQLAAAWGFDGIQLGPQGQTSASNPSPYDATLFSRNLLSLDPAAAARALDVSPDLLLEELTLLPAADRARYAHAFDQSQRLLDILQRAMPARVAREVSAFRRAHPWCDRDALYDVLRREHEGRDWESWDDPVDRALYVAHDPKSIARRAELTEGHHAFLERYALGQLLLRRQHQSFRQRCREWGLVLYGDLQIGMSRRDAWASHHLFMRNYRLGAPPSRTNPDGQAWGMTVFDPDRYQGDDGVIALMRARVRHLLDDYDGIRIDHPHGWVCPWVYRDDGDVRRGARLFGSPNLDDHPELARHSIARPEQIDVGQARHHDHWVTSLDDKQIGHYAALFDVLMDEIGKRGGDITDVACEVLSTQPKPLADVTRRYGLGRFRVTQKADPSNPDGVYRVENAAPEDWVMLGNHDTPPMWKLARDWPRDKRKEQAEYLAGRLRPDDPAFADRLANDSDALVHAKLANLFTSPAQRVVVFFADLLGSTESFNVPGTVDDENWSMRVAPDFRERGVALSIPRALALALRQRGAEFEATHQGLIHQLESIT